MASLNRVTIIGNCGKEPEMRFLPNGTPTSTFSVAVNNKFTNKSGEAQEETEWFNVVCWAKLAETVSQYLKKGQQVYVEGRQKTREWIDKDGQKHWRTELIAQRVLCLGKRDALVSQEIPATEISGDEIEPEELPF